MATRKKLKGLPKTKNPKKRTMAQITKWMEAGRCGFCGGRIISGDAVYPGYRGYPCCEDCKGV